MIRQYSSDWIHKLEDKTHWMYYWHQLNHILNHVKHDDKILEIGVGSRFTSSYLKSKGFNVTTLDIDADKSPDIIADIVTYKFEDKYDVILAFEVLEHIEYDKMIIALQNLSKVCNRKMIISIPRNEKIWFSFSANFKIFQINDFTINTLRNKIITEFHRWEVDYKDYSKARVIKEFEKNNLIKIEQSKYLTLLFFVFEKK